MNLPRETPVSTSIGQPSSATADVVVLMMHRARAGHGNSPSLLDRLFEQIAAQHHCVLPGEPLMAGRLNVCLSFDDAFYDFYHSVLPLLMRHDLRALLAVPTGLIQERVELPEAVRLALPDHSQDPHTVRRGLCTWGELEEMAASGRVAFAGHGSTHVHLNTEAVDLQAEVVSPAQVLEERLGRRPTSFVFPFGRFSARSLALVREHYDYAFRIGGASNRGWGGSLLYRVPADSIEDPDTFLSPPRLRSLRLRRWWNRLRRQ